MVGRKDNSREAPALFAAETAILQCMTQMLQRWLVQRSVLSLLKQFIDSDGCFSTTLCSSEPFPSNKALTTTYHLF